MVIDLREQLESNNETLPLNFDEIMDTIDDE